MGNYTHSGPNYVYVNPGAGKFVSGSTGDRVWYIPSPSSTTTKSKYKTTKTTTSSTSEYDLGYSLITICRPKFIWFEFTGLRPNTPHWIFFNNTDVTRFIRTGIDEDTFNAYPKNDPITNPGDRYVSADAYPTELGGPTAASGPLTSSATGSIYGIFYLQSNPTVNFPTGTNTLSALDVSSYNINNSLSFAKASYDATGQYQYYYEKTSNVLTGIGFPVTAAPPPNVTNNYGDGSSNASYGGGGISSAIAVDARGREFGAVYGAAPGYSPQSISTMAGYNDQGKAVDGGASCFVAGTLVDMADGSTKKIEDVVIGDKLVGAGGKINTVLEFDHPKLEGRKLYGFNGGKPFVTAEHPFMTTDGWKAIDIEATKRENPAMVDLINGYLETGNQILMNDGSYLVVESIEEYSADPDTQLYNFKLDGDNTYIADGFVVHNKGGGGCFTPDTLVDMADGSTKKIVDIKIGDQVWNKDKTAVNEVKFVEVVDGSEFGYLYSPGNEEPFATVNHPMFINNQIVAGDAEIASYHYPWLTKQYGAIKQLSNVKYKTAPSDLVYNLWLDGDGTYIVNGYGTTSIVGDGGLASIACAKGYLTSEEVVMTMKHCLQDSQELSYGAYIVNKMLGQLNWDPVTKAVSSIIHTLENPNSPLATALKVVGFAALVIDGNKTLFKKMRSVKTKSST